MYIYGIRVSAFGVFIKRSAEMAGAANAPITTEIRIHPHRLLAVVGSLVLSLRARIYFFPRDRNALEALDD